MTPDEIIAGLRLMPSEWPAPPPDQKPEIITDTKCQRCRQLEARLKQAQREIMELRNELERSRVDAQ